MLDFTSAVLLGALLFMLVQLVKKAAPQVTGPLVIVLTIVLAVVVVFVVRESDFAASQVVDGKSLNHLNVFSCVIVAFQLAAISVLGATAFESIQSIGQNNDSRV